MTRHVRNPVKRHGDTPLANFTIIPNELARDTELSMHAYRAAIVIRTHADGYELSSVSLAETQRWGRARTRAALRELTDARWLVIRPYKTADGKRAFEEYHVHAARKFTPEESTALAEPVILGPGPAQTNPLVPFEPTPWSGSDQPPGLDQAIKEDHLEDQLENQEENQQSRYVSNAPVREPVSPPSRPDKIDRTPPTEPVLHDDPDEYLPDDCSECWWHKRACSRDRELVSVGAADEPNWGTLPHYDDDEPPWG
jgi:hypothetical protein